MSKTNLKSFVSLFVVISIVCSLGRYSIADNDINNENDYYAESDIYLIMRDVFSGGIDQ